MDEFKELNCLQITNCRICDSKLTEPFLSLGAMPPANNLPSDHNQSEEKYPLDLCVCSTCSLVQLRHQVNPEILFNKYLYSSTSGLLSNHFKSMSQHLVKFLDLGKESLAIDIGSNDGLLLSHLLQAGVGEVIGVEPASNLVRVAEKNQIPTIHDFFSVKTVDKILSGSGQASLVTATNVFAHIDDIKTLTTEVKRLLRPSGVFVIEVPYMPTMIDSGTFDLVYHEHLSYFSVSPLLKFFSYLDMEIFKIEKLNTHGGSIRLFVQHSNGNLQVHNSVNEYIENEKYLGNKNLYDEFGTNISKMERDFERKLRILKNDGFRIAGYAAPAKASTLLGFANIGRETIDYIVDDNPMKQGHFLPGTGIPIVSSSVMDQNPPEFLVILAWNLENMIREKLSDFIVNGTKLLVPFKN